MKKLSAPKRETKNALRDSSRKAFFLGLVLNEAFVQCAQFCGLILCTLSVPLPKTQKIRKKWKKRLTNAVERSIIWKLSARRQPIRPKKIPKKLEKSFKKGIDKRWGMWYTLKVAAIAEARWSLKIEQQERSTKHIKVCANGSRTILTRILLKQK